jgi:hypothetical protein
MDKQKLERLIDDSVNQINPYTARKMDHVVYNYGFLLGILTDILHDDAGLRIEFMKRIEQLRKQKTRK